MMKVLDAPKPAFLLMISLAGFPCFFCHAEPLTGEERENLLLELQQIQEVLDGTRLSTRTSAVQTFQAASASDKAAFAFYVECHKKLKFDPKDASYSEFRDWRDQAEKRLKNPSSLAAMRLQLQYLVLSLRAAEGVKKEVIIPELENFIANIVSHYEDLKGGGMNLLRSSVKKTIFAEAYGLDKSLELENWSFSPGNYNEVYEKSVFPFVRENHPETLAATWDRRINLEKNLVLAMHSENPLELKKFETERLPQLQWNKAVDIFQTFSQKLGSKSMLALIKANATHPNLTKWVEQFRKLLQENFVPFEPSAQTNSPPDKTPRPKQDPDNPLGFENF